MTIKEFLISEAVIESDNSVFMDANICDEEDIEEWLKNYLYPMVGEDTTLWIINYPYKSLEAMRESLLEDDAELAKQIVLSALKYRRAIPRDEVYFINDNGSFHLEVTL